MSHASAGNNVEKIAPGTILDFDDPNIRIKLDLPGQIIFDVRVRRCQLGEARRKGSGRGFSLLECALRGRAE